MDRNKQCEQVTEQFYEEILHYCLMLLNDDICGAEDCTQDVFLLLLQKKHKLNFDQNIRGWLYASAERIVKDYKKKQQRRLSMLCGDLDQVADHSAFSEEASDVSVFEILTDQELKLLKDYYSTKQGERAVLAQKYELTLKQLYKKVHQIREKLKRNK